MPARDQYHDAVRTALEKEGWNITEDPYYLGFGRDIIAIDLAADAPLRQNATIKKLLWKSKVLAIQAFSTTFMRHLGNT